MGVEGARATKDRSVPKFWAYFALLQILPTSIVVNMFILARLVAPTVVTQIRPLSKQQVSTNKPYLWVAAVITSFGCLIQAGRNVYDGRQLIKLVLMGRSMLLARLVLGVRRVATDCVRKAGKRVDESTGIILFPFASTLALSIAQWCRLREVAGGRSTLDGLPTLMELWRVKDEHPAVASLSYDAIQVAVSVFIRQFVMIESCQT
jgi:hypothetical protein